MLKVSALAALALGSRASNAGSSAKLSKRVRNAVALAVLGQAILGEHEIGGGGDAHVGLAIADHQHAFSAGVDLHLQLPEAARQASLAWGKSMRQLSWSS